MEKYQCGRIQCEIYLNSLRLVLSTATRAKFPERNPSKYFRSDQCGDLVSVHSSHCEKRVDKGDRLHLDRILHIIPLSEMEFTAVQELGTEGACPILGVQTRKV